MGFTIFLGILGLIALVLIVSGLLSRGTVDIDGSNVSKRKLLFIPGFIALVVFAIMLLSGSVTNVTARTVGIVTEFGKATGTVSPGFNWVAPWADVTEFPTSNQVLDLDATDGDQKPVAIKFAGGGSGNVNVNITWQVQNDDKAVKLWQNWKEFDAVKNNLVSPKAQTAIAEVFGSLTPEDAVKGENISVVNKKITDLLNERFSQDGISVETVSVKRIDPSPEIQDRINKQVQAQADVERSKIEQQRAKIDNETNQLRQQSLTPEALVRTCYDVTNAWDVAKNGPLPAAWNCTSAASLSLAVPAR